MRVGSYEVFAVEAEMFRLDGGAMFGVVPRTIWEKTNPPDEKNRVRMTTRVMVIRGEGRLAVVDTGIGDKEGAKFREIYAVEATGGVVAALAARGIDASDVTDVIPTHLHFDHGGGGTRRDGDRVVPAFPRATYHIQRANLAQARHPNDRDRASFFPENFEPLVAAGVLREHEPDAEILPGVFARVINGHTPGHQMIEVDAGATSAVFIGEISPFTSHLPVPYVMGYDLLPVVTMEEKKRWLPQWAERGAVLVFDHDPDTAAARIALGPRGYYQVAERVTLGP
jgi:glyoxylase-like metal-dependent hydrolase (beta-lactamase superfamily II)